MSVESLLGLTLFNLFLIAVGAGLLWGIRGWRTWVEFLRLSGLAYFLGVAGFSIAATLELVVGVPFSAVTILLTGLVLITAGVFVGWSRPWPALERPTLSGGAHGYASALMVALVVLSLEGLFRTGRLRGLQEWDAWSFWVPKAKAIYFFGGLDIQFFSGLWQPTYPPLVPALEASAFHFMGSADVVTLHLQFWFLIVGFVGAAAGLLLPRVSPLLVWPSLLLLLVTPQVTRYALAPQADLLLDWLFALCALLVGLWILEQDRWMLVAATPLAAAAMITKREGLLLMACLFAAAFAVSFGRRRFAWPRLALAGAVAVLPAVAWRVWYTAKSLGGGGAEQSPMSVGGAERAWLSIRLTLSALFDYEVWSVIAPVAIVALALAFIARSHVLATYFGLLFVFTTLGFAWAMWALLLPLTKDQGLSPIIRETGALITLSAVFVPLLLQSAWDRHRGNSPRSQVARSSRTVSRRRLWSAPALVALLALAYPAVVLTRGLPRFPSQADCVHPPRADRQLEVVFGRTDSAVEADALTKRALEVGFQGTRVASDGCGRLKVVLPDVPSLDVGAEVLEEARSVDLSASWRALASQTHDASLAAPITSARFARSQLAKASPALPPAVASDGRARSGRSLSHQASSSALEAGSATGKFHMPGRVRVTVLTTS